MTAYGEWPETRGPRGWQGVGELPCCTCWLPPSGLHKVPLWGTEQLAPYKSPSILPCQCSHLAGQAGAAAGAFGQASVGPQASPFSIPKFSACIAPNRESLCTFLSIWLHCGYPRPLQPSGMRDLEDRSCLYGEKGQHCLWPCKNCSRGSGRFWSTEAFKDGVYILVLGTFSWI